MVKKIDFIHHQTLSVYLCQMHKETLLEALKCTQEVWLTLLDDQQFIQLYQAVGKSDLATLITLMQNVDNDALQVLNFDQVSSDLLPHPTSIHELIELLNLIHLIRTKIAEGVDVDSNVLIAHDQIRKFIIESELEADHVAEHLIKYVRWNDYVAHCAAAEYEQIWIKSPIILGSSNIMYYYRK